MAEYNENYEIHASPDQIARRFGYELATHAETRERAWDDHFEKEARTRFEALYPGVQWRSIRDAIHAAWEMAAQDLGRAFDAHDHEEPVAGAARHIDLDAAARTGNVTSEEIRADFNRPDNEV
jgi:hypothetical protein